jgi:hypothetical protein
MKHGPSPDRSTGRHLYLNLRSLIVSILTCLPYQVPRCAHYRYSSRIIPVLSYVLNLRWRPSLNMKSKITQPHRIRRRIVIHQINMVGRRLEHRARAMHAFLDSLAGFDNCLHLTDIIRKRYNRKGTKFGNNRVGRRGIPTCDQCRKRRIKVALISTKN